MHKCELAIITNLFLVPNFTMLLLMDHDDHVVVT